MTSKELITAILSLINATKCFEECRFDIDNDLLFIEGTYKYCGHYFDVMIGFYNDYSKINFCIEYHNIFSEYECDIQEGIEDFNFIINDGINDIIFQTMI